MLERASKLYDYWDTVRAGRPAPYRREIDPRGFREILDSVFILEWHSDRDARFRLAGTRLCESFGVELRGLNFLSLWHGREREKVGALLNAVMTEPVVGHCAGVQEDIYHKSTAFELLLLPLKGDDGALARVLGCVAIDSRPQRVEPMALFHWIDSVKSFPILQTAADLPCVPTPDRVGPRAVPMERDHAHAVGAEFETVGPTRAPRLRVIQGGRS